MTIRQIHVEGRTELENTAAEYIMHCNDCVRCRECENRVEMCIEGKRLLTVWHAAQVSQVAKAEGRA